MNKHCIFCNIIAGTSPAKIIYQDDVCVCFEDIHPAAPVHYLIVPRRHIPSLNDLSEDDEAILAHILQIASHIASLLGVRESGYRLIINTGIEGGQTVFHLHCHILGGKRLPFL